MNNTPATQQLTPVQQGWLHLAGVKTQLTDDLTRAELDVQGIFTEAGEVELPKIQDAIARARKVFADAKERRLAFTRLMDEKLFLPLMAYEKRIDQQIGTKASIELALRKAAADQADKQRKYNDELAAYRAHVVNEQFRIASEYRAVLEGEVVKSYTYCLTNKVKPEDLPAYIQNIVEVLRETPVPVGVVYSRVLVTDADALAVIHETQLYKPDNDLQAAIDSIPQRFAMYENDLANADVAAKAVAQEHEQRQSEVKRALAAEQATNVLISQASSVLVEGPKVKRIMIVTVEDGEKWAMSVVANFMKYWQDCVQYLRVKKWANLSIAQMADALGKYHTETGAVLSGLKTEEQCK